MRPPRRKLRALELVRKLETGPAFINDGDLHGLPDKHRQYAKQQFHLWCNSWILPEVMGLVPELRKKK